MKEQIKRLIERGEPVTAFLEAKISDVEGVDDAAIKIIKSMISQYDFFRSGKALKFQHKSGTAFAQKIQKSKKGEWVLFKGFSPNINTPVKWQQASKGDSVASLLQKVVKSHNKSSQSDFKKI